MLVSGGTIAVVGGGLAGRLTALRLRMRGFAVTLFDRNGPDGIGSCSAVAAGLLIPDIEAALGEPRVAALGRRSLELWQDVIEMARAAQSSNVKDDPFFYNLSGSFVCAREQDLAELVDFRRNLLRNASAPVPALQLLDKESLALREPFFGGTSLKGYHLPGNGYVNPVKLMKVLLELLEQHGATVKWHVDVENVKAHCISISGQNKSFDLVVDTRGIGAIGDIKNLRGVRGELILIESKELKIQHSLKFLHPRFPVYVVPRGKDRFIIGATCIESQSTGEPTVQSVMELLAGVADVHHGFRQANIISMQSQLRPALPDNLPMFSSEPGLMRINGLYRHGILLAPLLAEHAYSSIVGDGLANRNLSEECL